MKKKTQSIDLITRLKTETKNISRLKFNLEISICLYKYIVSNPIQEYLKGIYSYYKKIKYLMIKKSKSYVESCNALANESFGLTTTHCELCCLYSSVSDVDSRLDPTIHWLYLLSLKYILICSTFYLFLE